LIKSGTGTTIRYMPNRSEGVELSFHNKCIEDSSDFRGNAHDVEHQLAEMQPRLWAARQAKIVRDMGMKR
jgi:hypothetical protein